MGLLDFLLEVVVRRTAMKELKKDANAMEEIKRDAIRLKQIKADIKKSMENIERLNKEGKF